MFIRKTQEQFIIDAKKKHGDRYDYSKVEYLGNKNKVIIICKIHGEFSQVPNGHTGGKGCRKCADTVNAKNYSQGKEGFTKKSNLKHNNKYDYSKVEYTNNKSKVIIICSTHGKFKQTASDHLSGYGCPYCGYEVVGKINAFDREKFIEKAKEVHGDKFDYTKVNYLRSQDKVTIICFIHGEFHQASNSHLQGTGCPKCANELTSEFNKKNPTGYRDGCWYRCSLRSQNFDSYKVYLMKFTSYDGSEVFYKIGKSFLKATSRLGSIRADYKKEVIKCITSDNYKFICQLERELHKKNEELKYIPKLAFSGWNECFEYSDQIIFE
jgi:hypothetical protein